MLFEILDILRRGARLHCPCCSYGRLFRAMFQTHESCSACGERFDREPGQWFGAIYINFALSSALAVAGYLVTNSWFSMTTQQQLSIGIPVTALGPLLFFRVSRGLWLSIIFFGEGLYIQWPSR